jgi:hypothetical protein
MEGGKVRRNVALEAPFLRSRRRPPRRQATATPRAADCKMNMYLAVCRIAENQARYDVIRKYSMVDPKQC